MKHISVLRWMFIAGALIDGAIAASWFSIALGWTLPNIVNGYAGTDPGYRFALFVNAMFMAGWATLLLWGALNPGERKGLLPITAGWLLLSIILEVVFYSHMLGGSWFTFGVVKRLIISVSFSWAYCHAMKNR